MYEKGLVDGLYFALPTRAAATQLHQRVTRFVERLFPTGDRPETALAVPGYLKAGDISGEHLHDYQIRWDDHPDDATRHRRWAAENSKRYLAAQIAVGTVDQAMMAALKVKHAHMRAACLARNLLIVDERACIGHLHEAHYKSPAECPPWRRRPCAAHVRHPGFFGSPGVAVRREPELPRPHTVGLRH